MKSMFDNYFGGPINSRAQMQEKIKSLKTTGNVIAELDQMLAERKEPQPEKIWTLCVNQRGTPFVGDAFNHSHQEQ